jgi:aspartyl-tRNA(Asn)/glutamyl-tRNA(Gln) amidotransferase subunit A
MALDRLDGGLLRTLIATAGTGTGRRLLWSQLSADFGLDTLAALPPEHRVGLDLGPRPLVARPARQWEDAAHELPTPSRPSARALRTAYREGRSHPVEVLERVIEQLEAGRFGRAGSTPFVTLDLDRAREAAEASKARYKAGRTHGFLDGVPVVIKDQHDRAGLPTLSGAGLPAEPAREDSTLAGRLVEGGAIVYAKTIPTEFGLDPCGIGPHFPMPRSPYRADRAAGGSSTGSGVAVALGLCPVASGTDGGGSIRIPAALSGVFGLKPTYGRISAFGNRWQPSSLDHAGPLGVSSTDLVDFLSVVAGAADPRDRRTGWAPSPAEAPAAWRQALGRGVKGARIGVPRSEWAEAPRGLAALAEAGLKALEAEGAVLVDVDIPLAAQAPHVGPLIISVETRGELVDVPDSKLGEGVRFVVRAIAAASASDLLLAQSIRACLREQVAKVLEDVDLIALPTLGGPPAEYPRSEDGRTILDLVATRGLVRFAFLGNLTGLPAGTAPVGMHDGIPAGLQLIGDAWDEASVLAGLAQLERLKVTELPRPEAWLELLPS